MFNYNQDLLIALVNEDFRPQGPIGENPHAWAQTMRLDHTYDLPNRMLTREEVRTICRSGEYPDLFGYLCVMAWGSQGSGLGGRKYVQSAWNKRTEVEEKIGKLKTSDIDRENAYALFCGSGEIHGLGPAYFTKLLYFFGPDPANRYILDQWTAKSVLLLTQVNIIVHTSTGPTRLNTGKNYELFCRVVDDLKEPLNASSGEEVEQRLFSVGSIKRQPRGAFRQVVYDQWRVRPKFDRYSRRLVHELLDRDR